MNIGNYAGFIRNNNMLQGNASPAHGLAGLKIEDFGELQARYQSMKLKERAKAVLSDSKPALEVAERIFSDMSRQEDCKEVFDKLRKNSMLIAKLRPSDARVALTDGSCDFLKETLRRLAAWRKTMERLADGEAIAIRGNEEFIRADEPLAIAISSAVGISNYISIVQLALMELSRKDEAQKAKYASITAEIRRCATVLSDYENASSFHSVVH